MVSQRDMLRGQKRNDDHRGEESEGLVNDTQCILHTAHIFICLLSNSQEEWYTTVDPACLQGCCPPQRTTELPEGLVLDSLGGAPGDQV